MDPDDDLDPADVDALDDRTAASASTLGSGGILPVDLPSRGRLRLRSAVPVAKGYEGKAVSREVLFENEVDKWDDERYQLLGEQLDPLDDVMGSGLSISGDMEEEYNKLMRETKQELSVMRQPSAEDVAQKQADAQHLKRQIESWAALVETRIHLEAECWSGCRAKDIISKHAISKTHVLAAVICICYGKCNVRNAIHMYKYVYIYTKYMLCVY